MLHMPQLPVMCTVMAVCCSDVREAVAGQPLTNNKAVALMILYIYLCPHRGVYTIQKVVLW